MRKFLRHLESVGDIKTVVKPVTADDGEAASHIRHTCNIGGPALRMKDDRDRMPLVGGLYGSMRRVYGGMYCSNRMEALHKYLEAMKFAESESSVRTYDQYTDLKLTDLTLSDLPICKYNDGDIGKFITSGVQVVKDDSGVHQLGIHRMWMVDDEHLGCLAPPNRRVGIPFYEAEERGESIQLAVLIGTDPTVTIASQAKIPFDKDKYDVAEYLSGDDLTFTEIEGMDIPCETEIVIMCESVPGKRADDTPFAEYPGTYCGKSDSWVVKVTGIYTLPNPTFQALLTGMPPQEDSNLCRLAISAGLYEQADRMYPGCISDVDVVGNGVFSAIICFKKKLNEDSKNLIYALLANRYIKSIVVLSEDMDATEESFRWSFDTRCQPDEDIIITAPLVGASLDPSTNFFQITSKMGFDLTYPVGEYEKFAKVEVAGADSVDPDIDWS